MEQTILPITVTTEEALRKCVKAEPPLIFIHRCLCEKNLMGMNDFMLRNGYVFEMRTSKGGLFYSKGIDILQCVIPYSYDLE